MTEAEWLVSSEDPWQMLDIVATGASRRKLQLLMCAMVRHTLDSIDADDGWGAHFKDPEARRRCSQMIVSQVRKGIALVEEIDPVSLSQASCLLEKKTDALPRIPLSGQQMLYAAIRGEANLTKYYLGDFEHRERNCRDRLEFNTSLLRDIFGTPFRTIAFDPTWLTETVVGLAQGIYDDRAFERMPILADALQEAGCENTDILTHCREPGVHVRGCWVVDLLLGKS